MKNNDVNRMIDMMKEAYVKVMGFEKWNSLTDQEKHDTIMVMVMDATKAINSL